MLLIFLSPLPTHALILSKIYLVSSNFKNVLKNHNNYLQMSKILFSNLYMSGAPFDLQKYRLMDK